MRNNISFKIWFLGLLVGVAIAHIIIAFIAAIHFFYENISFFSFNLFGIKVIYSPIIAGVIVSLTYYVAKKFNYLSHGKIENVAHIIESFVVKNGYLSAKSGIVTSFINLISLGFGASAGREGPAAHIGAFIASSIGSLFKLNNFDKKLLLASGVAAAISASFNAPIAGSIFALEVIIGSFAIRYFVPISIASIFAALVTRFYLGDSSFLEAPSYHPPYLLDFFMVAILGIITGIIAGFKVGVIKKLNHVKRYIFRIYKVPLTLFPIFAGFLLCFIGIIFPEILGIGYEATGNALIGEYGIIFLFFLIIAKFIATTITLSSGLGGGIIGSSVVLGTLTGSLFGQIVLFLFVNSLFQADITQPGFYAMIGMASLAAAVISAPISTLMLVFEFTGDYLITVCAMLATSIACNIASIITHKSFFHWELGKRGLDISAGPAKIINKTIIVNDIMTKSELEGKLDDEFYLLAEYQLREAIDKINLTNKSSLYVIDNEIEKNIIGQLSLIRAISVYNNMIIKRLEEDRN